MKKVKLLKECEANIEIADYDLRTVAHLAAAEHHEELLTYLITKTDFDFTLKDRWYNTPIDEIKDPKLKSDMEDLLERFRKGWKRSEGSTPV